MAAPAPPRRVTILIDSLLGGGAERVAVDTACALDTSRYVPHVLVTRSTGPLERQLRERGVAYSVLDRRRGFAPRKLARACAIVRASDMLHAHKFEGSMWGALISRLTRRPMIAHEHTFDGTRPLARRVGYRWWIARRARKILCVSRPVSDSLLAEGVPPALLEVVPNGVPVDAALPRRAARAELGVPAEGVTIGIVGRLREEKRHELVLLALALLRDESREVTLCVVGDGPRAAELRGLARKLGVADAVVWAGERERAGRLVRAFDLVVLASSFEGMPLAILEALVAGVPVVATAVGSLPELLEQGGGTLVHSQRPEELAAAIAETLAASGRRPEQRATAWARASFGLERMTRELQRVYDEALEP